MLSATAAVAALAPTLGVAVAENACRFCTLVGLVSDVLVKFTASVTTAETLAEFILLTARLRASVPATGLCIRMKLSLGPCCAHVGTSAFNRLCVVRLKPNAPSSMPRLSICASLVSSTMETAAVGGRLNRDFAVEACGSKEVRDCVNGIPFVFARGCACSTE